MKRDELNKILKTKNINPNKNYGQNFLINEKILELIANSANISNDDLVIEIGPGLGALTKNLADAARRLYLIELDEKLFSILTENYGNNSNIRIINKDALKIDYAEFINSIRDDNEKVKIVSNLPYNITTEMITILVSNEELIDSMVLTIQREVAQKISAKPKDKDYNVISAFTQCYYEAQILEIVTAENFVPTPKVDSAVLKLSKRKDAENIDLSTNQVLKVIKASFSKRRKTLLNSLTGSGIVNGGKVQVEQYLRDLDITTNARPQEIEFEKYLALAKKIYNILD